MSVRLCLLWLIPVVASWGAPWTVEKSTPLPAAAGLDFREIQLKAGETSARLHVVSFSTRTHSFALMDDPADAYNLATAAQKRGAVAAVNGGYFQPDRTPLGLRVRQGQNIHPLEHARLLSGLLTVTGDRISLLRVGEFKRTPALREAVQAGPFLVDGGKPVPTLNATKPDPRTAIISDGASHFGLVSTSSVTLAELGAILATPGAVPGLNVTRALNLDGGSSTGLWVAGNPPFYSREFRNVRDFVAIVAR